MARLKKASIREPQQDKKREKHSANTDTKVKGDPVDKTVSKTTGKKLVEPLPLVQNVPIMQPAARKIMSSSQYHLIKSILQAIIRSTCFH